MSGQGPSATGIGAAELARRYSRRVPAARAGMAPTANMDARGRRRLCVPPLVPVLLSMEFYEQSEAEDLTVLRCVPSGERVA